MCPLRPHIHAALRQVVPTWNETRCVLTLRRQSLPGICVQTLDIACYLLSRLTKASFFSSHSLWCHCSSPTWCVRTGSQHRIQDQILSEKIWNVMAGCQKQLREKGGILYAGRYIQWQLSLWDAVLIYSRQDCSDNYIKQVASLPAGQQTSAQNHFYSSYQQLSAFIYRAPVTSLAGELVYYLAHIWSGENTSI